MLRTEVIVYCVSTEFVEFYFFFQAEDGIRDRDVTGVQTCALPISRGQLWLLHSHQGEIPRVFAQRGESGNRRPGVEARCLRLRFCGWEIHPDGPGSQ